MTVVHQKHAESIKRASDRLKYAEGFEYKVCDEPPVAVKPADVLFPGLTSSQ